MRRLVVCVVTGFLVLPTPSADAHDSVRLTASSAAAAIAQTNRSLLGVGWDRAPFTADAMAPLRPNLVRIDASFEHLYPSGPQLDTTAFGRLQADVTDAIRIGGEPVVILSYTPAWLADTGRPHSDPTKIPPSDAAVWRALVLEVVTRLSDLGVRFFEAWNEPDLLVFFQGLPSEFLEDVYRPSGEAVLEAERMTGRDLWFGGCACFFPDLPFMAAMIRFARDNGLPLDFLSWHHYGNSPLLGPDGSEPLGPPEFVELLEPLHQRNPVTSPSQYADHVAAVRALRDAMYAGAEPKPELWIDEWNLSAGGFDLRHDGIAGAAFQAGALTEFQRSGLDRASVFRSVDPAYGTDVVPASPELYGGWGLVGRAGTVKPAWWSHSFWGRLGDEVIAYGSAADARLGVEAILTRKNARSFVAIVSSFHASGEHAHHVQIRLDDVAMGWWTVRIRRPGGAPLRSEVPSAGSLVVHVDLGSQDVALVEISCGSCRSSAP